MAGLDLVGLAAERQGRASFELAIATPQSAEDLLGLAKRNVVGFAGQRTTLDLQVTMVRIAAELPAA